jgi:hypothetical protein
VATASVTPSTLFMADLSQHAQVYVEGLAIVALDDTNPGYLDLQIQTSPDNKDPMLILLAAIGGETLDVGTYNIVRDWPSTPNFARLYVVGGTIGCSGAGATVDIHDIAWAGNTLTALSMSILCPSAPDTVAIELRLNADGPIVAHELSADQMVFPRVLAGTSDPDQTLTVTSRGAIPLEPSSVVLSGTDAADFEVTSDGCSGVVLGQGETCSIVLRFAPIDGSVFDRTAWLTVHDNTLNGYRSVKLYGYVRRPTTITLSSVNNPATIPETPVTITPTVTPAGASGRINWYLNGTFTSFTSLGSVDPSLHSTILGTNIVTAAFVGTTLYAPSSSNAIQQTTKSNTRIELVAPVSPNHGPGVYDVTATVFAGRMPLADGGTLTIWDDTTSTMLGQTVLSDVTYLVLYNLSFAGSHDLRATFSGVAPNFLPSTASITVDGPPPSPPQAPWGAVAEGGEGRATVSWHSPIGTGGSSITGYVVTSEPGARTCATTSEQCVVTGLTGGTTYTFVVTASNAIGTSEPSAPTNAVTPSDPGAPTGSITIAGGSTYATATTVTLAVPATDAGSAVTQVALSNNGGATWTYRPYAAIQSWVLPATNGTRSVSARWMDEVGNWSAVATDTIVLDTVAPVAGAPTRSIVAGSALTSGLIPVRLAWTGADATSGIDHYRVDQSTDGHAYALISSTLTARSLSRNLAAGHTYRFRVRAVDEAGKTGSFAYGLSFKLTAISQSNASVHYRGTWATSTSSTWWGGTARSSSMAGATASYTFTGKSISWVGLKAATRGKAQIFINGVLKATVDLYSPTTLRQRLIWSANYTTSATRTITIEVLGTSGRPRVDVDGFIVGT